MNDLHRENGARNSCCRRDTMSLTSGTTFEFDSVVRTRRRKIFKNLWLLYRVVYVWIKYVIPVAVTIESESSISHQSCANAKIRNIEENYLQQVTLSTGQRNPLLVLWLTCKWMPHSIINKMSHGRTPNNLHRPASVTDRGLGRSSGMPFIHIKSYKTALLWWPPVSYAFRR
jgi:hypothetical protein